MKKKPPTVVYVMRIDKKLKYLAEIACRIQRCTLRAFITRAIKEELVNPHTFLENKQ